MNDLIEQVETTDINYDQFRKSTDTKHESKLSDGASLSSLSSILSDLSDDDSLHESEQIGKLEDASPNHSKHSINNMIRSVSDYEISSQKHRKKIKLGKISIYAV